MSNVGVKQGCPLSQTLFGLYINEVEKYLNYITMDTLWLFNTRVDIILYVDDIVMLSN
jgi:hypothetical protein